MSAPAHGRSRYTTAVTQPPRSQHTGRRTNLMEPNRTSPAGMIVLHLPLRKRKLKRQQPGVSEMKRPHHVAHMCLIPTHV